MNGKSFRSIAGAVVALYNQGYSLTRDVQKRFVWIHSDEDMPPLRARVSPTYPCRTVLTADRSAEVVRQPVAQMQVAA